jgi:hypothetical protein
MMGGRERRRGKRERGGAENIQGCAVHGGNVRRRGRQAQRLSGKTILSQPNHDLMARQGLVGRLVHVLVEEHIDGYVAIEVAGHERVRVGDGGGVVADGIGPVDVNQQVLDLRNLQREGGGHELGVGEGVHRRRRGALRVAPCCGEAEGVALVLRDAGVGG